MPLELLLSSVLQVNQPCHNFRERAGPQIFLKSYIICELRVLVMLYFTNSFGFTVPDFDPVTCQVDARPQFLAAAPPIAKQLFYCCSMALPNG